jgi:hypothetical protein
MRKALNSNPLVQIGGIAALGVLVAFLMLHNLSGGESAPDADRPVSLPTATDPAAATATGAPAVPEPAAGTDASVPTEPVASGEPATPAEPVQAVGEFAPGPGLPEQIVDAHEEGKTVVLLITKASGIDDQELRHITTRLRGEQDVALFHSYVRDIADYSRIAEGVDVDRVPALVAISPPDVGGAGLPVATISYGFRGYQSVHQAVRDANYEGKTLAYHP